MNTPFLYKSSQLESLSSKLAENIRTSQSGIFTKTLIITQGPGMNIWLTTCLAKENKVFAHFEFNNPDGFMGKVHELLLGEKPRNQRETIRYALYDLLNSADFTSQYSSVASYYQNDDLRRMQLATRLADLFDQYQLYRAEMVEKWENDESDTTHEAEPWQRWLWNALETESKTTLKRKILEALAKDPGKLKETYPEIHLFGISIFTGFHKDFYEKLAGYIKVHFYVCVPAKESLFRNPLLESYGLKAAELMNHFKGITPQWENYPESHSNTLLGRLQQSILNNTEMTDKTCDETLQVHSCHTPVREVEALYNYLLHLFEEDKPHKKLKASDFLVLTPDINKYEPFIKAVFRNAPVKLPIKVSGTAGNTGDSMTAALELIMNLREDAFTAENVAGLLEQNRISKAFHVTDCAYIRSVLHQANIRFGRENSLEDDSHYVSWKYGLEKIILGYAMLTDEEFEGKYPFKEAEASQSHDLLRLKAFVDSLELLFDNQKEVLTLGKWKDFFLEEILTKMVWCDDFSKEDRQERNAIYKALNSIASHAPEEEVPYDIFLYELKNQLFTEALEHQLNSGRITFTSTIPARGLPHKVIAFIGLDNGVFPRKDHFMGFDIMGEAYREGDRSKTEADKAIFLDTLMVAREKLYLSYIGQSVKDNTEIPPSIVLDTLVDYLQMEKKVVKHPLHGFSNKYDGQKLFTYLYGCKPLTFEPKKKDEKPKGQIEEIWADSFIKFFEAPIDWYFNHVLGIRYNEDDDTLPETELFELDYLQKWQLQQEMLLHATELETFITKGIKQGALPLKNLGRFSAEKYWEELQPLREKYQQMTAGLEEVSIDIDLLIDNIRIKGTLGNVFQRQYIGCTTSSSDSTKLKYRVRNYLRSLLLYASGSIDNATELAVKKLNAGFGVSEFPYPKVEKELAIEKLKSLLHYFKKGQEAPLKFCLEATKRTPNQPEITAETVREAFLNETKEKKNVSPPIPGNKYVMNLYNENYFEELTEKDLEEIEEIAGLLNI